MQTLDHLGASFNLASHDLDIRGGGNLLGEEQARIKSKLIVEKAIECLKNFGKNAKNLVLLAKYSINREF